MTKVPENNNISENLTESKEDWTANSELLQKESILPEERRNYKDSVFIDLFYTDENAGENLLSLYNALYDDSGESQISYESSKDPDSVLYYFL